MTGQLKRDSKRGIVIVILRNVMLRVKLKLFPTKLSGSREAWGMVEFSRNLGKMDNSKFNGTFQLSHKFCAGIQ